MTDRKCDTCIHRKADGCEKWECEYKERKGGLISRQAAIDWLTNEWDGKEADHEQNAKD